MQVQSICSEFIELYALFDVVPITSKQIVLKPGSEIFTFEPITTGNNNGLSTAKGEPLIGGQGPIKNLKLLIVLVGVVVTVGVFVGVVVTVGVFVGVVVTVGVFVGVVHITTSSIPVITHPLLSTTFNIYWVDESYGDGISKT